MNSAVINIKVKPEVKKAAQKRAEELGMSLSAVINGFLNHMIKTKTVVFSTSEEPTQYLLDALKESREDIKSGKVVSFKSLDEEMDYLDKLIADDKHKAGRIFKKIPKTA